MNSAKITGRMTTTIAPRFVVKSVVTLVPAVAMAELRSNVLPPSSSYDRIDHDDRPIRVA
jgi:hypothetical protein